ncbi:MAG: threonylcarbamoyl-AMP synthase [Chlamydiales bacterium]|nr:threonylcarbamoyl-AMP synthase [Chlamydiales bacterium]
MIISINEAKRLLLDGKNIAVPTETVYGLAGLVSKHNAIENIYLLKKRPKKNPLIVHVANYHQVQALVKALDPEVKKLMSIFWPGPLTFILLAKESISPIITGGLLTIGIRMPKHPELLELIEKTGPLAAPSANLSGRPSATLASHIETDFGKDFPIMEGDPPSIGVESTIIGFIDHKWKIFRLGAISKEELEEKINKKVTISAAPICPGSMYKHYSPKAILLSKQEDLPRADALVGYFNRYYPSHLPFFSLGRDDNPKEITRNLFNTLRQLDEHNILTAWVDIDLPSTDAYATIIERLKRAMDTIC